MERDTSLLTTASGQTWIDCRRHSTTDTLPGDFAFTSWFFVSPQVCCHTTWRNLEIITAASNGILTVDLHLPRLWPEVKSLAFTGTQSRYIYTQRQVLWEGLPLAMLFLVRAAVLAARAKDVHYLGYEACKHRLETERNSIKGVIQNCRPYRRRAS